MRSEVMILEKVLKEKLTSEKYTVQVRATKNGNLPNRAPFVRQVYRQTTLNEFIDSGIGEMKPVEKAKDIIYTVHARYLKEDKISELHDMLVKDLNEFMYKNR
tara:strand:+ start:197 stop:505 length:309 start_codon:yes stop_codon:yes gene_type:complete